MSQQFKNKPTSDISKDKIREKLGTERGNYIVAKNIYGEKYWKKKIVYKVEPPYITNPKLISTKIYLQDTDIDSESDKFEYLSTRNKFCLKHIRKSYNKFAEIGIVVFESFLQMHEGSFNDNHVISYIDDTYPEIVSEHIPHIIVIFHVYKNKVYVTNNLIRVYHDFITGGVKSAFIIYITELYINYKVSIFWDGAYNKAIQFRLT
jgi:hypothetical protein